MAGIGAPQHDDVIVRAARAFLNGVPINNKHTFFFEGHVEVNKTVLYTSARKINSRVPESAVREEMAQDCAKILAELDISLKKVSPRHPSRYGSPQPADPTGAPPAMGRLQIP